MRRMRVVLTGTCGLILVAMATGCDAEVGENYTGELLFELRGQVTTDLTVDSDTVLALGFPTLEGTEIVDGRVTGEFPSSFRFEIDEAPPAGSFTPLESPGGTEIAFGYLLMLPRDHARVLPYGQWDHETENTDGSYMATYSVCADDGRCFEQDGRCWYEPCELVAADGDPIPESEVERGGESEMARFYDTAFTFVVACHEGDALGTCYREYRQCEIEGETAQGAWSDGTVEHCEVLAERGSAELRDDTLRTGFAANFMLVYAPRPVSTPMGDLQAGYNILGFTVPTAEEWLAARRCESDAVIAAHREYNEEQGTDFVPYSTSRDVPTAIEERIAELQEACPQVDSGHVVDPSAEPLSIRIGSAPPSP